MQPDRTNGGLAVSPESRSSPIPAADDVRVNSKITS